MGKFRNRTDEKFRDKLRVLMKLKEGKIQSEKDLQKLARAGFSYEIAQQVLKGE